MAVLSERRARREGRQGQPSRLRYDHRGVVVVALYLGEAHTEDGIFVYFPKERV